MNSERIEKLVGWLSTGAVAFGLGAFLLVWGWLFPLLSGEPASHRRTAVDPNIALGGGSLLILVGILLVVCAVVGKIRER